ncbi:MAG: flagellar biosynthesis protein FlgN [Bacillota bacterium]
MADQEAISEIERQVDLYQELLELLKEERELLHQEVDTSEIEDKKREIKDEIAQINTKLDIKHSIKQPDKLRLISDSEVEKLNQLKPTLKEVYQLQVANEELTK